MQHKAESNIVILKNKYGKRLALLDRTHATHSLAVLWTLALTALTLWAFASCFDISFKSQDDECHGTHFFYKKLKSGINIDVK